MRDITEIYPFDYKFSIGIRKLARFDYENRENVFYDGSETNVGWKSNVGAVEGIEYVFSKDSVSILFIQGRVHYYDNGIRSKNPSPYASCFIFFREKFDV